MSIDCLLIVGLLVGKYLDVLVRELCKLVVIDSLWGKEMVDYVVCWLMISEFVRI